MEALSTRRAAPAPAPCTVVDLAAYRAAKNPNPYRASRELQGEAIKELQGLHETGELAGFLVYVQRTERSPLMAGFGTMPTGSDAAAAAAAELAVRMTGGH